MSCQVKTSGQCQLRDKKHEYFSIVSLLIDSVIVDHAVEAVSGGDGESFHIQAISRVIMSPAELKKQPTIHFQSKRAYFKYSIVL
jgi:acid stress-induced BolA-like protein IbaG/YrbA